MSRRHLWHIAQISPILVFALLLHGCQRQQERLAQPPTQQQAQQQEAAAQQETPPASPAVPAPATTRKTSTTSRPVPAAQTAAPGGDADARQAFGSKNAPVTMEVFSDFQCPACKTLFVNTNRQVMDNYVSTGKVYLVHRDFPLPLHAYSLVAARYARAAAQLGKFETAEQALFQNQEKWEQTGDVDGTVASVLSPAEMTKVRALVKGGTLDAAIEKDRALGQMYNVNQTPTTVFHSGGQTYPYAGVMSYEILKQFLDQLLSQK